MDDPFSILTGELESIDKKVRSTKATHVSRKALRNQVRDFIKTYFEKYRPTFLARLQDERHLESMDGSMQELLTCCNKTTARKKYFRALKSVREHLNALEPSFLLAYSKLSSDDEPRIPLQEKAIIDTLEKICPTAARSYIQGLLDLGDEKRQSWRGTATEFREALRETLDHLAPDDAVTEQPGFKVEKDRNRPTMKQKVVFVLKNRKVGSNALRTAKSHIDLIEEKTGAFVRSVYDRSSASTHGAPSRDEVTSIKNHVTLILAELLQVAQ